MLFVNAGGTAAGSGGAVVFGNSQSHAANSVGMAAIKGYLRDGSNNTNGDLAFSTRGGSADTALTERMRILYNGNVGIGTANPITRLHVQNGSSGISFSPNGRTAAIIEGNNSSGTMLSIIGPATANAVGIFMGSPTNEAPGQLEYDNTTGNMTLCNGGCGAVSSLFFSAAGNFGIGNVTPSAKLTIADTNASPTSNVLQVQNANDSARYLTVSSTSTLMNPGNISGFKVGIGTSIPLTKLQVGIDNVPEPATLGSLTPQVVIMGTKNDTTDDSLLRLIRPTYNGSLYPASVDFKMKSYGSIVCAPCLPHTQLTIGLKQSASYDTGDVVDVMALQDNGNVGIGTTSPGASLEINKTVSVDTANIMGLIIGRTSAAFTPASRTIDLAFKDGPNAGLTAGISSIRDLASSNWNSELAFYTSNDSTPAATTVQGLNERMRIDSSGNVGIGTASPHTALQVNGAISLGTVTMTNSSTGDINNIGRLTFAGTDANAAPRIFDVGSGLKFHSDTNGIQFIDVSSNNLMIVQNGGNVGIGTSAPTARLAVNGVISPTSNILQVANANDSTRYFTVSSSSTQALNDLFVLGNINKGSAADIADIFQVGTIRKNFAPQTDTLGNETASGYDTSWGSYDYPDVITWTTSSQVSPRGVTETVGQVTSTGSSDDYRTTLHTVSTGISDVRGLTFTFSFWAKTASGSSSIGLSLGRYADNDGGGVSCAINSTNWTRCSYTRTFNNTSYADDSEIRAYTNSYSSGVTYYLYGAQIERSSSPTAYQKNTGTSLSSAVGIWSPSVRIGNTAQAPNIVADSNGMTIANSNSSPTTNILEVRNTSGLDGGYTAKYLTVSSTSTHIYGNLTLDGTCTGCGGGSTLQSDYNSSTSPELTLDGTRGALTIRDAGTAVGNLLELQNNSNSKQYLTVSSTSTTIGTQYLDFPDVSTPSTTAILLGGSNNISAIESHDAANGIGINNSGNPNSYINFSYINYLSFTDSGASTAFGSNFFTLAPNSLTTGSGISLTTSSASLNSTNGVLYVANTTSSTSGVLARLQSNSTTGSGLTVRASGNVGVGTASPTGLLTVAGAVSPASNLFQVQNANDSTRYMTVSSTNTVIGSASNTYTVTPNAWIAGNLTPSTDNTYTLGDWNRRWKDVYVGPGSLHIGNGSGDESVMSYDTTAKQLVIRDNGGVSKKIGGVSSVKPLRALNLPACTAVATDYNAGYSFTVKADGYITALGARKQAGTQTVYLYVDTGGGSTAVRSATVTTTGVSGDFVYTDITPYPVTAGSSYVVSVRGNSTYCQNSGLTSMPYQGEGVQIDTSRYVLASNLEPDGIDSNTMYGQADVVYQPSDAGDMRNAFVRVTNDGNLIYDNSLFYDTTGSYLALRNTYNISRSALSLQTSGYTGYTSTDGLQLQMSSLNANLTNYEAGSLAFGTNGSTRMTIDSNGNVGIGTTSTTPRLTVRDGNVSPTTNIFQISNSTDSARYLTVSSTSTYLAGNVGIGTTNPANVLDVYNGATEALLVNGSAHVVINVQQQGSAGLCHASNGAGFSEITDCASNPTSDYMEMYPTDADVEMGYIVAPGATTATTKDGDAIQKLTKTTAAYQQDIIGVVSNPDKAGDFNSVGYNIDGADHPMPIALSGRVKVVVTSENGAIKAGDPITSGARLPGVGMKATQAGRIVGIALSSYDNTDTSATGSVMVFMNGSWFNGADAVSGESTTSGSLTVAQDSLIDFKHSTISNVAAIISSSGNWSVTDDGYLTVTHVTAKTVDAEEFRTVVTDTAQSTGEGSIQAGSSATVIHNGLVKPNSRIFVTFDGNVGSSWWVAEKGDGDFTVHLAAPAPGDVGFTYWIMNIDDQRTPSTPVIDSGSTTQTTDSGSSTPLTDSGSSTPPVDSGTSTSP